MVMPTLQVEEPRSVDLYYVKARKSDLLEILEVEADEFDAETKRFL